MAPTGVPHTVIAGAGLGGLCLAQGLRRVRMPVTVLERDADPDARAQGYRLHLDTRGSRGLRASLPKDLFALVEATSGQPASKLTIATTKLRTLKSLELASGGPTPTVNTSVDRGTLREILLTGLDEHVRFGAEVVGYEADGDAVTVGLADGTEVEGDILVGADGVHSAVRRQLLPDATLDDPGEACLYGATPLDAVRGEVPDALHDGFMAVVGMRGLGMALGVVAFREAPEVAAAAVDGASLSPRADYVMWAISGRRDRFKRSEEQLEFATPDDLHGLARELVAKWDARLRAIVDHADAASCAITSVLTARDVAAWETTNVTLLGDAIHAMSPAGGSGANMALQDGGLLAMTLARAVHDDAPIDEALAFYEARMLEHGFAAVHQSLEALRGAGGLLGRLGKD